MAELSTTVMLALASEVGTPGTLMYAWAHALSDNTAMLYVHPDGSVVATTATRLDGNRNPVHAIEYTVTARAYLDCVTVNVG